MEYNKQNHLSTIRAQIKDLMAKIESATNPEEAEKHLIALRPLLDEHPDGLDTEPLLVDSLMNEELKTALETGHPADLKVVVDRLNQILLLSV